MAIQIRTSLAEPGTGDAFVPHKPARPAKSEGGKPFVLVSDYEPAGDQPTAIARGLVLGHDLERPPAIGLVGPRGLVRNESGGGVGFCKSPADHEFGHEGDMGVRGAFRNPVRSNRGRGTACETM